MAGKAQAVEIDKVKLSKITETDTFHKLSADEKRKYQDIDE